MENREKNSDLVSHPAHYTQGKFEVIDIIEDAGLCFIIGNTIKYCLRAKHKGNELQDLQKARWYLDRKISKLERETAVQQPKLKKNDFTPHYNKIRNGRWCVQIVVDGKVEHIFSDHRSAWDTKKLAEEAYRKWSKLMLRQ